MAHKYQTFADLLYISYSGLQMMGFAFSKGKKRYDKECYAFRMAAVKKFKAGEMKISDLYQNIIRQMTSPHDSCWHYEHGVFPPMRVLAHYLKLVNQYAVDNGLLSRSLDELSNMDLPFDFHYMPRSYPQPEDANESLPIKTFQLQKLELEETK